MLTTPFQQQKEKQLWMLKLYKHHHHFCKKKKNATQEIITNQNVSYRNRTHKYYQQSVY